jgi:O-antigen chain-terminating methyltransferase
LNQTPLNQVSFYRAFEDRYRGPRDIIKDRLRAYARFTEPLLQLAHPLADPSAHPPIALDLGCGRGEWLELLGENGFDARGVDLDEGMLAACRERGLNAQHGDALAALRATPDASLALVSAFHLVEHLPFELVQELIAEALRVLQPGGLLIMETPNPENLTVGATSFYLDPTHRHPLPPGLLGFAAEHAGFARQRIVRLQEDPHLHSGAPVGLITVLAGVSPDYGVVAQKAADAATLASFDAAFDAPWGITLGQLALRYEEQRAAQHAEIHQILARIERHGSQLAGEQARAGQLLGDLHRQLGELHRDLGELHRQLDEARHRAGQQEARIAHVEAHAAEMSQRVVDLLSSTSWRITEPLRRTMSLVYRLRNAQREGRLGSAAKSRMKRVVRRAGGAVLRRPALKRAVRAALRKVPALESRLYALMLDNSGATRLVLDEEAGELSPRAARIYRQLKQEQARMSNADSH